MQLAPLQLTDYFVHSIHVEALPKYDPGKDQDMDADALHVTEKCFPITEDDSRRFAIDLVVKQDAIDGKNIPYAYELHMVGFIEVHPDFPEEKMRRAVETNGPSMLFGAAREIIRAATGRGPYGPVLIPSTTFFRSEKNQASEPAKSPVKKVVKRKSD